MDRQIVYPGQIPLETDLLNTNRNTMIALGKLAGAILGTGGIVNGLAVAPTGPASLSVNVNAGEIYQLQNVDNTAYSTLPADTTDTCVKQGVQLQPVALACAPPSTAGYSINYLIEATYQDSDTGSVVLPYYNASNPQQAYSGPANSGAAQATKRAGIVSVQAKAGIAATTGTQTTPTVDAGYIALAVVTVANGQSTITAGNIVAVTASSVLTNSLLGMINANSPGRLLNIQVFSTAGTFTYTKTPGTNSVVVDLGGAGGGSGGCPSTTTGQFSTTGGGGGGAFCRSRLTSGFDGATIVIGAGGSPGSSTTSGTTGGTSTFGAVMAALGGGGSAAGSIATSAQFGPPAAGGAAPTSGNLLNLQGGTGALGWASSANGAGGPGGACGNGFQGVPGAGSGSPGITGVSPGTGAGGNCNLGVQGGHGGAAGAPGFCYVAEYA